MDADVAAALHFASAVKTAEAEAPAASRECGGTGRDLLVARRSRSALRYPHANSSRSAIRLAQIPIQCPNRSDFPPRLRLIRAVHPCWRHSLGAKLHKCGTFIELAHQRWAVTS